MYQKPDINLNMSTEKPTTQINPNHTIYHELIARKIIAQFTDEEKFKELVKDYYVGSNKLPAKIEDRLGIYCGFDPTSDTLHMGHFAIISTMFLFARYGFRIIFVIGDGTAKIGDPSDKNKERPLLSDDVILVNANKIEEQLETIIKRAVESDFYPLPLESGKNYKIVRNNSWWENTKAIPFMRETGKYFTLQRLLARKNIKKRVKIGISLLEAYYHLFQAYDFQELYKNKNILFQLGGSDQFGNIASGIDLIQQKFGKTIHPQGITLKLLTNRKGEKISKTQINISANDNLRLFLTKMNDPKFERVRLYFIFWTDLNVIHLYKEDEYLRRTKFSPLSKKDFNRTFAKEQRKSTINYICKVFTPNLLSDVDIFKNNLIFSQLQRVKTVKFHVENYGKRNSFIFTKCFLNVFNEYWILYQKPILDLIDENMPIGQFMFKNQKVNSMSDWKRLVQQNAIRVNSEKISDFKLTFKQFIYKNKLETLEPENGIIPILIERGRLNALAFVKLSEINHFQSN